MKCGTNANYVAGCRCDECRNATRIYHKRLNLDHNRGIYRLIDATGTRRRIQALGALGWTGVQIGERLGVTGEHVRQIRNQGLVTRELAARVAVVYESLAMSWPPETTHKERHNASRQRNKARRLGWLPPLAYVDIDNPDERPDLTVVDSLPDPVVVERILSGDWRLKATAEERAEVVERWTGTLRRLEELTGWNVARDQREKVA